MLAAISGFIIHLINSWGYIGIFVLMALESALTPVPSEIVLPFAGFLASKGTLVFYIVVLAGAFGNLFGSLVAYYIGYILEESVLLKLIRKYGKFVLLSEEDYVKSSSWFEKYGSGVVFFSRLLPAVRTFISLPAGMLKMNIWKFSFYTFIGSLLWSLFLTYIGYYLGSKWDTLGPIFTKFQYVIVALVIIAVVYFIFRNLRQRSNLLRQF